jgi:hypothetical protein
MFNSALNELKKVKITLEASPILNILKTAFELFLTVQFLTFFGFLALITSYLTNCSNIHKNPTGKEPRDLKLVAEVKR